ncbi:MAG: 2OG-Fe(II) oxygenase [Deltaproteobacteria bacterium]|nr:2OG-Fe(II) oxygenase [Deltaproteobacteria bacterium]
MKVIRHRIEGRELIVLDDILATEKVARVAKDLSIACFPRMEHDGPGKEHVRTFALDMQLEAFKEHFLFDAMKRLVAEHFPGENQAPYCSYCNLIVYGDMTFPHRDCEPEQSDVTALYYVNTEWKKEWAGETLYYDADGNTALAVNPRPGRLVLFRGGIEHNTGIPSRTCFESRLTVACKFRAAS